MNQYELAAVTALVKAVEQLCDDGLPVTVATKRISTATTAGRERVISAVFIHNETAVANVHIAVDPDGTIYHYPLRENTEDVNAQVRTDLDVLATYIHDLI